MATSLDLGEVVVVDDVDEAVVSMGMGRVPLNPFEPPLGGGPLFLRSRFSSSRIRRSTSSSSSESPPPTIKISCNEVFELRRELSVEDPPEE